MNLRLLDAILRTGGKKMETDTPPEHVDKRKYQICSEDKPDETNHGYCGKKDTLSPACTLTLRLEGLTHERSMEIELEIRNMLERHEFRLR